MLPSGAKKPITKSFEQSREQVEEFDRVYNTQRPSKDSPAGSPRRSYVTRYRSPRHDGTGWPNPAQSSSAPSRGARPPASSRAGGRCGYTVYLATTDETIAFCEQTGELGAEHPITEPGRGHVGCRRYAIKLPNLEPETQDEEVSPIS